MEASDEAVHPNPTVTRRHRPTGSYGGRLLGQVETLYWFPVIVEDWPLRKTWRDSTYNDVLRFQKETTPRARKNKKKSGDLADVVDISVLRCQDGATERMLLTSSSYKCHVTVWRFKALKCHLMRSDRMRLDKWETWRCQSQRCTGPAVVRDYPRQQTLLRLQHQGQQM